MVVSVSVVMVVEVILLVVNSFSLMPLSTIPEIMGKDKWQVVQSLQP